MIYSSCNTRTNLDEWDTFDEVGMDDVSCGSVDEMGDKRSDERLE